MTVTKTEEHFTDTYAALRKSLPDEPGWMGELRDEGFQNYMALGLPTTKHEEWRWTNLKPIRDAEYTPAPKAEVAEDELAPYLIEGADEIRLVFVNGRFDEKLSKTPRLPDGLVVRPITRVEDSDEGLELKLARFADHQSQPFTALNTATFRDGAYIRASKGLTVETPIHVMYVSTDAEKPAMSAPRTLILAGETADLMVVESYVGLGESPRFVNGVSEIVAKQSAYIKHVKLLQETDATNHVGWNEFRVDRDANVTAHCVNLGAGLARNDVHASLVEEGANITLNGLVLGRERQHFDNHLEIDHIRPHCTSNQLYRSVVDDRSRSVFSGKVIVRPGADGTDAQQQNNNLLLSDTAKADTKPQLEIYADDVKCAHGATSGQLDAEAIFFLRTRGLPERTARNVLTYAFANDIIERINIDPVRKKLEDIMAQRFAGLLGE